MITIYKYCIEDYKKNVCRVILPIGAQILKIYSNGNKRIDMWAKVDTTAAEEVCYFYIVRTGENITKRLEQRDKSKILEYIDSFYDKDDIHWHIFKAACSCGSIGKVHWGSNDSLWPKTISTTTLPYISGTGTSITLSSCCTEENGVCSNTLSSVNSVSVG
mgnify:CR=1 FL=1